MVCMAEEMEEYRDKAFGLGTSKEANFMPTWGRALTAFPLFRKCRSKLRIPYAKMWWMEADRPPPTTMEDILEEIMGSSSCR